MNRMMMNITASIALALCVSRGMASETSGGPLPEGSKFRSVMDIIENNKHWAASGKKAKNGELRTFSFTEGELNEFIRQLLEQAANKKRKNSVAIKSAVVRLKEGHLLEVSAVASFDPKVIKMLGSREDSAISGTVKDLMTIDNSVDLECLVTAAKGTAFIKVRKVKLKGIPIPDALLQKVLTAVGKKQRPPLDLNKPFRLPNGIRKINILPQKLLLGVQILS